MNPPTVTGTKKGTVGEKTVYSLRKWFSLEKSRRLDDSKISLKEGLGKGTSYKEIGPVTTQEWRLTCILSEPLRSLTLRTPGQGPLN